MNWNLLKPASWPLDQVWFWHVWICGRIEILLNLLTSFRFVLSSCVVYHPQTGYSNRSRCSSTSSSVTGFAPVEVPTPPQAQPQASGYTSRPNVPHKQVTCTQTQISLLFLNSRHPFAHTECRKRESTRVWVCKCVRTKLALMGGALHSCMPINCIAYSSWVWRLVSHASEDAHASLHPPWLVASGWELVIGV